MIKDDRAVLFVHVPKTGGSTIERLFQSSGWIMHLRETRETRPRLFPLRRCSPQHYQADLLAEMFDFSRFDLAFLIVRDPVARFRSEFAMRHTRLESADEATVDAWAEKIFGQYATNPYVLDNHLRPQSDFLTPGAEVYRLEDGMKGIVKDLNKRFRLQLDKEIPHHLKSENRGLPSSAVQVSGALRERLQEFYAADYEQFGYAR